MPNKFVGFLDGKKIYEESGNAIKVLIDGFGSNKLFEFLKKQINIAELVELKKVFKDIYGAELDYEYFNKLLY